MSPEKFTCGPTGCLFRSMIEKELFAPSYVQCQILDFVRLTEPDFFSDTKHTNLYISYQLCRLVGVCYSLTI